ncbi:sugar phosphate/phosphate translocator [Tripterygium wilfordii]|uniref:Sugar phosphate/phosphate translocator n=1 Tax=Tripterygium wilfordii TaxID=458696 RepID=A0A7J7C381_TRIWF|nr:sugar phosphate/phosphate translocator [Tripterygium wilfordii]
MADRQWKGMLTYAYILLYIALSSGQIFFNKWVLSSKEINFPYPLGLTLLHMVFSSVLCFTLTKVLKIMKVEEGMTLEIYSTSVVPIGAMFAMTPLVLTLNSLCTFALNLSVFLVISHTSALTIRVAGVVKDWVVVLLSALFFADTKLTIINLFGYGIAILGVASYNNHKLKKEARVTSEDPQNPDSIPLAASSISNR